MDNNDNSGSVPSRYKAYNRSPAESQDDHFVHIIYNSVKLKKCTRCDSCRNAYKGHRLYILSCPTSRPLFITFFPIPSPSLPPSSLLSFLSICLLPSLFHPFHPLFPSYMCITNDKNLAASLQGACIVHATNFLR